jgi:hypothetical protein
MASTVILVMSFRTISKGIAPPPFSIFYGIFSYSSTAAQRDGSVCAFASKAAVNKTGIHTPKNVDALGG